MGTRLRRLLLLASASQFGGFAIRQFFQRLGKPLPPSVVFKYPFACGMGLNAALIVAFGKVMAEKAGEEVI